MQHIHGRSVLRTLIAAMILVFPACLEYETTTTVNTDGSFTRSITVSGDSSAIHGWDFRIPADQGWSVREIVKVDDRKWTLRADRDFGSEAEWTAWNDSLTRRVLDCSIVVDRSFRFFTTSYRLTETIASYNPFRRIPLTDYISPSELEAFLRFEVLKESYPSRGDSLALKDAGDRFTEWEKRTRIESLYAALEQGMDPSVRSDTARMDRIKASIIEYCLPDSVGTDNLITVVRRWAVSTREHAVVRAIDAGSEALRQFAADVDFVNTVGSDTYVSRVRMPGTITSTNGELEGTNGVVWSDYIAYAYIGDFTMIAESSVVNVWAIVLTIALIIGLPLVVWAGKRLRTRG